MAGDWIKFETATPDKPEVWQIASELQIDPDAVVGKLLRVWAWFDSHTEEGNAPSVTKTLLDRNVAVAGFCDAMVSAGWMQDDGETITLPNFHAHNGKTAKNRALTAKRVAKSKRESNDKGNGDGVTRALPREEKRREEDNPPVSPPSGGRQKQKRSQIPADFKPDDVRLAWAGRECPAVDPKAETQQFIDHHRAKGNTFADHRAAWRTWMGKAQMWAKEKTPKQSQAWGDHTMVDFDKEGTTDA